MKPESSSRNTESVAPGILVSKSSRSVFHTTFPELACQEAALDLLEKDIRQHGPPYAGSSPDERPAAGAFVIVTEEGAAEMLAVLTANGLSQFADRIAVDFHHKPITLSADLFTIEDTPVESEMILRKPRRTGDSYRLAGRIIITDPQFTDSGGTPVAKVIPSLYCEQVLKALNPFELLKSLAPTLDEKLRRACSNADFFKSVLVETAKKWKSRTAPKDFTPLERYATQAILHEASHFLACHLPDDRTFLPPEEAERQRAFGFDRYLEILNADESLPVVYAKNLAKALHAVDGQEPGRQTEAGISVIVLIEMFCDRFGIFLYENFLKVRAYQSAYGNTRGDPSFVKTMLEWEDERGNDPGGFSTRHPELTPEIFEILDHAPTAHVYTDQETYGDSPLSKDEQTFFRGFLGLLREYDARGTILSFSPEHVKNSRVIRATFSGLISGAR